MEPRFDPARALCQAAVGDGVVPGMVVLAASGGAVRLQEAFGHRQLTPRLLPALPDTVYDVASLTKAVATSVVAMQLCDHGAVALDEPVRRQIPEFLPGGARDTVTVRWLLCHASGLPAHRPFYAEVPDAPSQRWAIALRAAHEPLAYAPGTQSVYSDLGFILLGWLVERAAGLRLDVQVDRGIVLPLGLTSTTFVNLADSEARARLLANRTVAATQQCAQRNRVVLGEVDDLNAYAMGGIAGHAGLFSTAGDLGAIAAALCAAWRGDSDARLVNRDVIRQFWSPAGIPGSVWRLGWDGPSPGTSQAGTRLPKDAVGHLAFTGCSLWIDPARDRWIILLSNRVHPHVPADDRFRKFRPALHDALVDALDALDEG
ncbi:MAG TPA: serine hydrolase domain-containing protein [Polyangia bacterium]|jgi:CubicO group peptidase (beta-lactamase class C family)|nr:serine hydrolase domain-containing protein [Polyangia bacterium]